MNYVPDFFAASLEQVRRSWGWFLIFGILLMILGVLCVGKAQTSTTFSILALGWVLAISGALWLVNSFFAFQLARILSVPAERDHPRSHRIPPDSSFGTQARPQ